MASSAFFPPQDYIEKYHEQASNSSDSKMFSKQFSRTWRIDEPRRYWEMLLHCERTMYPRPMPDLALHSMAARFYWHPYSANAKHDPLYQKNVNLAFLTTLNKLLQSDHKSKSILISEQLLRLDTFDPLGRKGVVDRLEKYICRQTGLEILCMEGLLLKRNEGLRLVSALRNSRKTLKKLYCWRAFRRSQGPIVIYPNQNASLLSYTDKLSTNKGYLYWGITCLEALTTLSLNYGYIATPTGDLLLELAKTLGVNWQWLQLLCQEHEIPTSDYNTHTKAINYAIPDVAWQASRILAPALKVQFVLIDIPEYDRQKRFLTQHTPVHTFILSTGFDLSLRQPWFIDCTIKTLWSWYPNTIVHLYLQLWHHRENLDNLLEKLFINLPELQVFEFVGEIRNLKTLCSMCCLIRARNCKVNHVNIQLQDVVDNPPDRKIWSRSIECLLHCFKKDFDEMGVRFHIGYYPG